ncbi:MAG: DUF4910 domain-containing protein [Nitrososphaeria archaeon]|nr:DUF4910 domain-containing protein [Nitrososphaeria archaeon]
MIRETFETIWKEYSGERAKNFVSEIINFHRIQGSPGYRKAAEYVCNLLKENGLECEILKFPATENETFWNYGSFQESYVEDAKLFLIKEDGEEKVADYSVNRFSIIQRSAPTPEEGIVADLIVLGKGDTEKEYKNIDVKGKVVFASGDLNDVYFLAVEKGGAIGIVTDRMREWPPVRRKMDLPDALQYCSFWWHKGKRKCFGFVVSPRTGARIRELAEKRRLKVRAVVKSRIYDGSFEVVSAKIRGEEDREIIVIAHLCHPQPSANDNASGVAAAIESALVLNRLIAEGKLNRPRKTIRFLFVPEITGTVAFLNMNKEHLDKFVAGVNLDMIGEDQRICESILMIDSTPYSLPSFINPYIEYLFDFIPKRISSFSERDHFPSIRYEFINFSGGSDHEVLSDPSIGIPTVSFTNWPDKYYHTSEDTLDKVDPNMLLHVGATASTLAYTIANFCKKDYEFLALLIERYCEMKIDNVIEKTIYDISNINESKIRECAGEKISFLKESGEFWRKWLLNAIEALDKLDEKNNLKELCEYYEKKFTEFLRIKEELFNEYLKRLSPNIQIKIGQDRRKSRIEKEAEKIVPKRKYPGPIDIKLKIDNLNDKLKKKIHTLMKVRGWRTCSILALFWADGKRSVLEIWEMLKIEYGHVNLKDLIEWFHLLEKMEFVTLEKHDLKNS